jgi:hypothetical protein
MAVGAIVRKSPFGATSLTECSRAFGPSPRRRAGAVAIEIEWESDAQRMERCDHEGTTELLSGMASISHCTACGKNWAARFGAGAPTVPIVAKTNAASE